MKRLSYSLSLYLPILGLLIILSWAQPAKSQCPPDDGKGPWTQVIDQAWTLPSGCHVLITYCYRDIVNPTSPSGWERQFWITGITLVSGCEGLTYSDMIHEVAESLNRGISTLPLCDGPLHGTVVTDFFGSCWELTRRQVVGIWYDMITVCGSGKCSRTCDYCLALVDGHYVAVESNCTYSSDYTGGCQDISGGWQYDQCYHLPCTTGW
jgi:hypothetical protein